MRIKTGLERNVTILSVNFNAIDINDILDIHKYVTKKT